MILPVRAPPPDMPRLGYLTHNLKSKIYALYGGPRYDRGSQYEYYVELGPNIRVPLCTDPNRFLGDNDVVTIPSQPGGWTVTLDDVRRPY